MSPQSFRLLRWLTTDPPARFADWLPSRQSYGVRRGSERARRMPHSDGRNEPK